MIATDGVPTQFVTDPQDPTRIERFAGLRQGQALTIEDTEAPPSPKGESDHTVYRFKRLCNVRRPRNRPLRANDGTRGTTVRFNHA